MKHPNDIYMKKAIEEAKRAADEGEYPIGALIVLNDKIIAIDHRTIHKTNDPTAHA
jgi:tRNA(adenine34) deaminase